MIVVGLGKGIAGGEHGGFVTCLDGEVLLRLESIGREGGEDNSPRD